MKLPSIEINQQVFYKWGFFLFMFVAVMNTFGVFQNVYMMRYEFVTQILSAFGTLAFNYLIAGFFYYLWGMTKPSITDDEFEKSFNKVKGGKDDTTKTKTKRGKRRAD